MGIDQVKYVSEVPELSGMGLEDMIEEYKQYHDQETEAKAKKKELGPQIEALLVATENKSLRHANMVAIQSNGSTASWIDGKLLAQAGVDADVIANCTVGGTRYTYIQIREVKE